MQMIYVISILYVCVCMAGGKGNCSYACVYVLVNRLTKELLDKLQLNLTDFFRRWNCFK